VGWPQTVFGALLVAALLFVSLFYAWRQFRALRALRASPPPDEEARYEHAKARRRLANSVLMLVLAGLLASGLVYFEAPAQRLADQRDAEPEGKPLSPQDRPFARAYGWYWIAVLLVLLAVVVLAAIDLFSTRRYGLRQYRKLQADRRAMVEHQVARLRQQRNGHEGDGG
jgi:di/tricarboxylate transporter